MIQRLLLLIVLCIFYNSADVTAQVSNDDCFNPILLNDVTDWCSTTGEFTNVGSTASTYGAPSCFTNVSNDVWFAFTAVATDIVITISGKTQTQPGGTLQFPEAALYEGFCGGVISELQCTTDQGDGIIQLYKGGLFVGTKYLIRVDGRVNLVGTFQICLNNYNPPDVPQSDCPKAAVLCDKSAFVVKSVVGAGQDIKELNDATCFNTGTTTNYESNSTWFTWVCETPGPLTFTLTPDKIDDDLDFVIYELPNGVHNCQGKIIQRCMASGDFNFPSKCMGPTGLKDGETDVDEPSGCGLSSQDNYLAPLIMTKGTAYALVVNNFTSTNTGFSVKFGGESTFEGPDINFTWDPDTVKCLEEITFTDSSTFALGNIIGWNWSFGEDALAQTATGIGPHTIIYNSWGPKFVTLVTTSNLGCKRTKTKELYIEVCCLPGDNFQVKLDSFIEPHCHGFDDGQLFFSGTGGNPWYKYSVDDLNFTGATAIGGLTSDNYQIHGVDSHGCRDSIDVFLDEPLIVLVNAGEDQTVDLGYTALINASTYPFNHDFKMLWTSATDSMFCDTCFNIEVLPPGTTTYKTTIVDDTGCMAMDEITIFVKDKKPVYIPNAFSPNGDGYNEGFTAFGSVAARRINLLRVYSRWGELVFETKNIELNQPKLGWDGLFNGKALNPGVYVYYIEINFVDNKNVLYKGDINLLK
ncbi:MAG TPA: gliding motility-associated C-terminal domain-containing protein [Saprospiraceae bacterium]|nr:gliding motility-associated C-terminal domain-containing protein [Saprospiraceae bacterium]